VVNSSRTQFDIFFSFGRSQSMVELMGPDPVLMAHQVLAGASQFSARLV